MKYYQISVLLLCIFTVFSVAQLISNMAIEYHLSVTLDMELKH